MSQRKKRRKKKLLATTIDQAYQLYLISHDNKAPTASRFKKFINDDKRVQMDEIDFVTADTYLRKTGKGPSSRRTPSGLSSNNISSPSKKVTRKRRTGSLLAPSTKTPKKKTKSKHYRTTHSVDYKEKLDLGRKKPSKSRDERPIASIAAMSSLKPSKYKTKSGRKGKKKGRKSGRKGLATIRDIKEQFQLPGDDELAALIQDIVLPDSTPNSPQRSSTSSPRKVVEDSAVLKSFPFCEHMKEQHVKNLAIHDNLDHRYTDGLYMQALILQKNGTKYKIRYGSNRNHEVWSDYKYELYRFAKFRSITVRPAHRMLEIRTYDTIMFNPRRSKRKGKGWREGTIIKKDYKSGQVQIEYEYKRRKYHYWTHLDNIKEIRPYAPMTQAVVQSVPLLDLSNVKKQENNIEKEEQKKEEEDKKDTNTQFEFDINMSISEQLLRATERANIGQKEEHHNKKVTVDHKEDAKDNNTMFSNMEFDLNVPISEQLRRATERAKMEQPQQKEEPKQKKKRIKKTEKIETMKLDYNNINGWNGAQVLHWLCMIEKGRFAKHLKKWSIKGDELLQINHLFLKMMGVDHEKDRTLILNNIQRIAPKPPNVKNGTHHKRKMSEVELEQGIKKATQKYNKENKKLLKEISKLEEANKQIHSKHTRKISEHEELQTLFDKVQTQKKKPTKELLQLRQQNKEIADTLSKLTLRFKQQEQQLKARNDEAITMRTQITSLNKEMNKKDKAITSIQSEKEQEITEYKMKLNTLKNKYEKLNSEYIKQKTQINDATKDSYYDNERALLNGSMTIDIDENKEIPAEFEQSPESIRSEDTLLSYDEHDYTVYEESDDIRTIIIDNGSETIKLGYGQSAISESHKPSKKFHSIIGRAKQANTYSSDRDIFVGDEAYNKSAILHTTNVLQRGNVMDWELMEKVWDYTFYSKLAIPRSNRLTNHNVLLTECIGRRKQERYKSVQVMFETFTPNSMFMVNEAALSLYGVGKVTGTVLGIGYGVTYSTCIFEGNVIPRSMIRVNSAGYDITKFLKQILSSKFSAVLNTTKHSVIKDMKQKYCFVADNFYESLQQNANSYKKYKLPDGQYIRMGNERFIACEQLFNGFMGLNNEDIVDDNRRMFDKNGGIHNMVYSSIAAVPDDDLKEELYSTGGVILSGGSTLFKGLSNRLKTEIYKLSQRQINIVANDKRKYLAWIGGSILSSLPNCIENFIQRSEYEEYGPNIVDRKCP